MFKFNWADVLTDEIVRLLVAEVAIDPFVVFEKTRDLLLVILQNEGGFPVSETELTSEDMREIIYGVLDDALRRTFPVHLGETDWPGVGILTRDGYKQAVASRRIALNVANATGLAKLPGISEALAEHVVSERSQRGPFSDKEQLVHRVKGIAEKRARAIDALVHYRTTVEKPPLQPGLMPALKHLLSVFGGDPTERLLEILEATATSSGRQSPERWFGLRMHHMKFDTLPHTTSSLELLRGSGYYVRVKELIQVAKSSIDVAMFHIAFPKDNHPTSELLKALVEDHTRGVRVRVLVDRDRPSDPYGSRLINRRALKYLAEKGVPVRVDRSDRLLHSKVVVIDNKAIILGSHNWSAGSYFHYDDLSVLIESPTAAKEMTQRYSQMWMEAEVP